MAAWVGWAAAGACVLGSLAWASWRRRSTRAAIEHHAFPEFLLRKLRERHPGLDAAQARQVERGLRQFFLANWHARGQFVAMPSKVVDTLWHEFILYTRGYEMFCRRAFGRLLHHTPAEAMRRRRGAQQEGLRRAWRYACLEERIDPRKPGRLPLLFALDALLAIEGGYRYVPDCSLTEASGRGDQCAADIGCGGSSCGGWSSSDSGSSGDGGGDGSGCGGGGCGGGD